MSRQVQHAAVILRDEWGRVVMVDDEFPGGDWDPSDGLLVGVPNLERTAVRWVREQSGIRIPAMALTRLVDLRIDSDMTRVFLAPIINYHPSRICEGLPGRWVSASLVPSTQTMCSIAAALRSSRDPSARMLADDIDPQWAEGPDRVRLQRPGLAPRALEPEIDTDE